MVFDRYAQYYDLLYREKDYSAECDYLEDIFQVFSTIEIKNLMDVGCGTGGHVIHLAERGYHLVGIDQSETMLEEASRKCQPFGDSVRFVKGDLTDFDISKEFDAVISMFAVIGYLPENNQLAKALSRIRKHLRMGGLFIFDVWYGPAVLNQKPADRYKIVNEKQERIIRFVESKLNVLMHNVEVNYKVLRIVKNVVVDDLEENHRMRYFFPKELEYFLSVAGFELLKFCPFMDLNGILSESTWNMGVIARAI
jgi:SAM-dependent methyltransferase